MMKSNPKKRLLMIIGYIVILTLLLLMISRVIGYLNQGANRSDMLHLPEFEEQYHALHQFVDNGNDGEPISDETLHQLHEDYLMAWASKNRAIQYHQPAYLSDYFTPSLQAKYQDQIDRQISQNIREEIVTLNHETDIKFHNLDKSMIVLEDNHLIEHRRIFQDNKLILSETDTSTYQAICLREDGHWRVRHLTRTSIPQSSDNSHQIIAPDTEDWVGYNYYPQEHPWDTFNIEMGDDTYQADMELLKSIGTNSIRIFLQYEDFGGPSVSQDKLDQLKKLMDSAEDSGIGIILTLFDFYSDYRLDTWTQTDHHTRSIISAVSNHPALLAYDIKNEPDLDFDDRGKSLVLGWLLHQINVIRSIDDGHPITIGWSTAESAVNLSDEVDFVSFHYYKSAEEFGSTLSSLKDALGHSKPVLLSEFGMTSYRGAWNPIQFSESKQAAYLTSIISQCQEYNIGYLAWTLYDFPDIPTQVVGSLPWRKAYQQHYGLINLQGEPKQAYELIK